MIHHVQGRRFPIASIARHTCNRCIQLRRGRKRAASFQLGKIFLCLACAIHIAKTRKG